MAFQKFKKSLQPRLWKSNLFINNNNNNNKLLLLELTKFAMLFQSPRMALRNELLNYPYYSLTQNNI